MHLPTPKFCCLYCFEHLRRKALKTIGGSLLHRFASRIVGKRGVERPSRDGLSMLGWRPRNLAIQAKMVAHTSSETCLRHTSAIVYCAIDSLVPLRGRAVPGFDDFSIALAHANIPSIWITSRNRAQMDEPLRKLGHAHPFIAEGGGAAYLPTDYFHLRGEKSERRGRFLSIPVAEPQPAAEEALEILSEETSVPVVPLRSLSPRELAQNSGLPQREAELARQRDFDELFFFAGASDDDIQRFLEEGQKRKLQLRQQGALWSLAVGASVPRCVRHLTKLFDRALHGHAPSIGLAPQKQAGELFPACDRNILLVEEFRDETVVRPPGGSRVREISLHAPDVWEEVLAQVKVKN
jgi:predicted mannosyl-3-phosphoglycerate phosphatase (HAD superfamily)